MLQPYWAQKTFYFSIFFQLFLIFPELLFFSKKQNKLLVGIGRCFCYISQKIAYVIQQICKSFKMIYKVVYGTEIHVMNSKEPITYAKLQAFIKSVFKKLPSKYTLTYKDSDEDVICLLNDVDVKILSESGMSKVRIEIQECSEQFYDQTQQIVIEEVSNKKEQELTNISMTESKTEAVVEPPQIIKSNISEPKNIEDSINEKLSKLMPDIISKIKEEVMTESKIREPSIVQEPQVNSNVVHEFVTCDECGAKPIVGIRYKCVVCPDFDVCEKCEAKSTHDHPFLKIRKLKHTPIKIIAVIDNQEEDSLELNGQRIQLPGLQQGLNLLGGFLGGRMRPEQCKKEFGQCRQNFKKMAHNFKEFMSQNNMKFQCPMKKKQEEEKVEKKVEEKVEPKVEEVKPEPKKEENTQPIIIEQKKEQKKVEIKQENIKVEPKLSQEEVYIDAANYIAEVMGIDYKKVYRFVINYPGLTKEEILMKYLEK